MFTRYAVFYTPPPGSALCQFGASWLGWDSAAGQVAPHPSLDGVDVAGLTETPRPYGFHGTLKPPFRLAEGATEEELRLALADLAGTLAPVSLPGMSVQNLSGFVALRPEGDADALAALGALAGATVQRLDAFRAPLNAAELAKRRRVPLTERQEAYLDAWGYPYVLEEFRYHMTLSGHVSAEEAAALIAVITPLVVPTLPQPFLLDALTLLGEGEDGRFRQLHRYALTG
ncbi:MAG: DUF1045 domain-containing protein [Pseudomonadota bacterium]